MVLSECVVYELSWGTSDFYNILSYNSAQLVFLTAPYFECRISTNYKVVVYEIQANYKKGN